MHDLPVPERQRLDAVLADIFPRSIYPDGVDAAYRQRVEQKLLAAGHTLSDDELRDLIYDDMQRGCGATGADRAAT